ncbi:MAG: isocitrate lyase/phosphoenolpyruvate mutase family protein [Pseudoruegeria sp.]
MTKDEQRARAFAFRQSHHGDQILVLPNAWDTGSAVMFARAGFQAVGTTSAGVAYALGYPDGEAMPFPLLQDFVTRTAHRITPPLSVDFEEGFATTPHQIAARVCDIIACGAVGLNLEDQYFKDTQTLQDIDRHCAIIEAVAAARDTSGIPFVLNARINTHWYPLHNQTDLLKMAIERSNRCLAAGADCAFIPSVAKRSDIKTLVQEIDGPVNILSSATCPPIAQLQDIGVARISIGSSAARAMLCHVQSVIDELQSTGTFSNLYECSLPYGQANSIFD